MSARGIFVTGTDTEVGKTVIACALVRALRESGSRVAVMKPVASGARRTPGGLRNDDALALIAAAATEAPYEDVNPYCFEPAVSPHIAAKDAGISIDVSTIRAKYQAVAAEADWVVVEGAGGWLAPLSDHQTMADLAWALSLPALLVVGLKLGCLNHAQLTRLGIEAHGVSFAGWVASGVDAAMARANENLAALERVLGEPALAIVPHTGRVASLVLQPRTVQRLTARTRQTISP
jgi:dethiobiotin synthetase